MGSRSDDTRPDATSLSPTPPAVDAAVSARVERAIREWREPVTLVNVPFRPNVELVRRVLADIEADRRAEKLRARHTWERVLAALSQTETEYA